jgi:hypothetical protein
LSEITLTVRIVNKNGTEARKYKYDMTPDSRLHFDPGGDTKGLVQLDSSSLDPGQTLDWKVAGAKGLGPH